MFTINICQLKWNYFDYCQVQSKPESIIHMGINSVKSRLRYDSIFELVKFLNLPRETYPLPYRRSGIFTTSKKTSIR